MTEGAVLSWTALLSLGAFHGINPGMGWLFAVALGMQEGHRRAVWRAMLPLAAGHALAIGAVVALAAMLGVVLPAGVVRYPVAAILVSLGVYRLVRQRHPRWGGMQVSMGGLTTWSFLMASAHGAGLMVLPVVLGMAMIQSGHGEHAAHGAGLEGWTGLLATLAHSAAYLLVTALVAWVVFEKLGLGLLRRAWINLDLIWAGALIVTGGVTLLI